MDTAECVFTVGQLGRQRVFDGSQQSGALLSTRSCRNLRFAHHSLATDWLKSTRMRRSSISTLFIFLNACVALCRRRPKRAGVFKCMGKEETSRWTEGCCGTAEDSAQLS